MTKYYVSGKPISANRAIEYIYKCAEMKGYGRADIRVHLVNACCEDGEEDRDVIAELTNYAVEIVI